MPTSELPTSENSAEMPDNRAEKLPDTLKPQKRSEFAIEKIENQLDSNPSSTPQIESLEWREEAKPNVMDGAPAELKPEPGIMDISLPELESPTGPEPKKTPKDPDINISEPPSPVLPPDDKAPDLPQAPTDPEEQPEEPFWTPESPERPPVLEETPPARAPDKVLDGEEKAVHEKTWADTEQALLAKIDVMTAQLNDAKRERGNMSFGKIMDSFFKLGGLQGKTIFESEADAEAAAQDALDFLRWKQGEIRDLKDPTANNLENLKRIRIECVLPELPISVVGKGKEFDDMVEESTGGKSGSVPDYQEINRELRESEAVLDTWEIGLKTVDAGQEFVASMVPGGSELLSFIQNTGDILSGAKTPAEAASDFAMTVVSSKIGGTALKKAGVMAFVEKWVAKNTQFFSKKVCEKVAQFASSKVQSAITSSLDVARGEKTPADAVRSFVTDLVVEKGIGRFANDEEILNIVGKIAGKLGTTPEIAKTIAESALQKIVKTTIEPEKNRPLA